MGEFQREASQEEAMLMMVERSATSSAEEVEAVRKRLRDSEDIVTHFVQQVGRLRRSQGAVHAREASTVHQTSADSFQNTGERSFGESFLALTSQTPEPSS